MVVERRFGFCPNVRDRFASYSVGNQGLEDVRKSNVCIFQCFMKRHRSFSEKQLVVNVGSDRQAINVFGKPSKKVLLIKIMELIVPLVHAFHNEINDQTSFK
jgi:hypothetical protein